jgi:quinohemoprotein ethanol dehydrogenase
MLASADTWRSVVLEGSRTQNGMVSFAQVLTPDLAELVRAYVVARANDTYPQVLAAAQPN